MNNALGSIFSNPLWVIPDLLLTWALVTFITSRVSGWAFLSRQYGADEQIEGETYRFVWGSLGKGFRTVRYSNTLFITVGRKGLYISTLFPFLLAHKPLLIPWSQIDSMNTKYKLRLFEYIEIVIKEKWPVLQLRGRASKKILEAFKRYSQEEDNPRSNWRGK